MGLLLQISHCIPSYSTLSEEFIIGITISLIYKLTTQTNNELKILLLKNCQCGRLSRDIKNDLKQWLKYIF